MVGNDLDSILHNPMLDLATLTVFDKVPPKSQPSISMASASNITVRKTSKSSSRHFRGRHKSKSLFEGELIDLRDVPISVMDDFRALRESSPDGVFK